MINEAKSYSDFMNEITAAELYTGLLAYGMFAEKLPPVFSSKSFFDYVQANNLVFQGGAHKHVYYENMRNINVPRPLAIPNPFAYQQLCAFLKDIWPNLQSHFHEKTKDESYRVSRIHLRNMFHENRLFQMNYGNWRVDGSPEVDILMTGKRYIVKADISSCFPSIYTHALSWALVTKETAKGTRNNRKDSTLWYNKIDELTRKLKNDETHGLLIGPHVSNLLAEIILTSVDSKLREWSYIRAIDDYTCYVDSHEDGERFLTELGAALREYDLSLNHKKTEILELPLAVTDHWLRKLNMLPLTTNYGKTDFLLVRSYLDHAIELMEHNKGNAAILNYAIKVLSGKDLTHNAKEYFTKTVLSFSLAYPYLVTLLDKYIFSKYCAACSSHSCIRMYADQALKQGLNKRNFEQVSYALFFAIKYDFQLDSFDVERIIASNDSVLLLLAYYYANKEGRKEDEKKIKALARLLAKDLSTFDEYWVFLYEILPQSDLKADWQKLKKAGISFVKPLSEW